MATIANITTKEGFKDYCFRKLGYPVLQINMTDEQAYDRIDDALKFYFDYHYDGTEKTYLAYPVTETDKTRKYIIIPDTITSVIGVFPIQSATFSTGYFSARYQITFDMLFNVGSTSLIPYYVARRHMEMIDDMFGNKPSIEFNRNTDKLQINMDWRNITTGTYIIVECYKTIDPEEHPEIWNDRWLQSYATSLLKKQWGENLSKFSLNLPGNVTYNGREILQDAKEEIEKMERDAIEGFGMPLTDVIG